MGKVVFLWAMVTSFVASAQHNLGIATSDYSTINSIYLNPANIAGCKEKIVVNFLSLNALYSTDYGHVPKDDGTNDKSLGITSIVFPGSNNFNAIFPAYDVRLPSFLVNFKDNNRQGIAITTRYRTINQFTNCSQQLFNSLANKDSTHLGYQYTNKDFRWLRNQWKEVDITYGIVIAENNNSQFKAGITARYLFGGYYMSLKGNKLELMTNPGDDTLYCSNTGMEFITNAANENEYNNNSNPLFMDLFAPNTGSGMGFDFGMVLTNYINGEDIYNGRNDDPEEDMDFDDSRTHRIRASVSIKDLGAITYKGASSHLLNVGGHGVISTKDLIDQFHSADNIASVTKAAGFNVNQGIPGDVKIYLPTSFVISLDYQFSKSYYATLIYIRNSLNQVNAENTQNFVYDQITLVPRFDSRKASFSIPITYSMLGNRLVVGMAARAKGVFAGFDDTLIARGNKFHGFDGYMGYTIQIYPKKKRYF